MSLVQFVLLYGNATNKEASPVELFIHLLDSIF